MKTPTPVYVVDIIGAVCDKVTIETAMSINYQYGFSIQVLESLKGKDGAQLPKYPLIALYFPIREDRGKGYYADVTIKKIVIASLTNKDDRPVQRYENVFKTILYPVYYSFMKQLALNQYSQQKNPDMIIHTKTDYPGITAATGINDFVDTIEITNLQISLKQIKFC